MTKQGILTNLENAVQHDLLLRQSRSKSGRSPKSIHAEALKALDTAYMQEFLALVGEDEGTSGKCDYCGQGECCRDPGLEHDELRAELRTKITEAYGGKQ